ncbi:helix-turn-helix domain-containing protein [Streptococcus himalayensis]|uniref:HTH cro/C1-type domain-containing protein n=1 Tax=Streptococcus himalayensis TaxID=1888195 RepID=A0A917A5A4_9STRE|nr:helix-turn-helix transcriptional regulator [Streptococcus himalayensis]GGE28436.1 hypothetical protein GCM10011510_07080 [Streptococcus himalayensis]
MNDTNNLREYIGKRIRLLRLQKGWTQYELEEKASLPQNYCYKLETLYPNIQMDTLVKVMDALDTNIATFFNADIIEENPRISNLIFDLKSLKPEQQKEVMTAFEILLAQIK